MMERKTLIGILLVIAGLAICIVSIWMLADTIKIGGISAGTSDAPKVGMAAGVLAVAVGITCFVLGNLERAKNIMLGVVLVVLIFAIATFSLAIKERMDIKKAEDGLAILSELQKQGRAQGYGHRGQGRFQDSDINALLPNFDKLKTQLVVLIVVAVIACVLEIASLVFVFKLMPQQTSRNAQMDKPY